MGLHKTSLLKPNWIAGLFGLLIWSTAGTLAFADFEYSYHHPQTPLDDGYIVSVSNAVLYTEGTVRCWKPNIGGTTFENTTPGQVIYHFEFDGPSDEINLWMGMPVFHWSYSRGHNQLFGSTNGSDWELMADLTPPAFGSGKDLGTVDVPDSLLGADELWLKVDMYSYGSSAPGGGFGTNTAQLSRYDVNLDNQSFSLSVSTVPEPSSASVLLATIGCCWVARRKRRTVSFC